MTKLRSRFLFALFVILLVLCLVACFVNFTLPFRINGNYYSYSNFVSNISLGEDVGESLRIVYRAELPEGEASTNYGKLRDDTLNSLRDIVQGEGHDDVTIAVRNSDEIVLQIGNILTDDDESLLIDLIGNPQTISFSLSSDVNDEETPPFADKTDVESVTAQQNYDESGNLVYGVLISFKESSHEKIAEATADGGTLYIFLGEDQFTSMTMSTNSDGSTGIANGQIFMQSDTFVDLATANTIANRIRTGLLSLDLTQIECGSISPSYGVGANVLCALAIAIFVLIAFIFFIVKYKQLGLLASFAMLFFITLSLFFLQSIPLAHINFAGLIGILIGFVVLSDNMIELFERAKKHYLQDTKLNIAFKLAQKESLTKSFVTNVGLMIVGFISLFMPALSIQSFGWVVFVMSFVSIFTQQALMRLFINMYLPLSKLDGRKCNFSKGGKNA